MLNEVAKEHALPLKIGRVWDEFFEVGHEFLQSLTVTQHFAKDQEKVQLRGILRW